MENTGPPAIAISPSRPTYNASTGARTPVRSVRSEKRSLHHKAFVGVLHKTSPYSRFRVFNLDPEYSQFQIVAAQ